MRYGIIGSGMMGQEHIRNLDLLDGVQVAAVSDPDTAMRDQAASLAGCSGYETHGEMLAAEQLDALVIAAPNHLHHAVLSDVMAGDVPILCEKPLGVTLAECQQIESWATARRAPVWVAMEYRYMPAVAKLLDVLDRAGAMKMVAIQEHRYPFLDKVGDWNRFSAQTGGTLVEKCCHHFDLMRLILRSDPVRVYASGGVDVNHLEERYDGRVPDIIDNAFVIVDFANGARGMLDLCMFAEGVHFQEIISVTGDAARLDARIPAPSRFLPNGEPREAEVAISPRKTQVEERLVVEDDPALLAIGDHHGSTFYQHVKFRDLILNGNGAPDVTVNDALISVAVGSAAEASARSGQAIELDTFKESRFA